MRMKKQACGHGSDSMRARRGQQEEETEHAHALLCAASFLQFELLTHKLYVFSQDNVIQTAKIGGFCFN